GPDFLRATVWAWDPKPRVGPRRIYFGGAGAEPPEIREASKPSVSKRLVVHEHVLHALLALGLAAEAHEGLALELEHLRFGDLARRAAAAAAKDLGELGGDLAVVLACVARVDERADHHLERRDPALAREHVRLRR